MSEPQAAATGLWRFRAVFSFWSSLTVLLYLATSSVAQQQPGLPATPGDAFKPFSQSTESHPIRKPPLVSELDLLRRNDFAHASAASISVRVTDNHGKFIPNLGASDFHVVVNDTVRTVRLTTSDRSGTVRTPAVLFVFRRTNPRFIT